MEITDTPLPGVKLLKTRYFDDHRGTSTEAYSERTLREHGFDITFVVDYLCYSSKSGTLRGIHAQNNPRPQLKLVRVLHGAVLDCVVDLRPDSPFYKQHFLVELSEQNRTAILVPAGYGHAYKTLQDDTIVYYKFDEYYDPRYVRSIRFDDPELGLSWGLSEPIISVQDGDAPVLSQCDLNLTWAANPS